MQYPFSEGVVVAATKEIIEDDVEYDPEAGGCEPGWRHAHLGDIGVVVGVDNPTPPEKGGKDCPTVRFMNSETATLVFENEVIFVAPTAADWAATLEVYRQSQIALQQTETFEKRLAALDRRERATNKLLNVAVMIFMRNMKLKPEDEEFLKKDFRSFHEAHGLDVEKLDKWIKEGGSITLGELSKDT